MSKAKTVKVGGITVRIFPQTNRTGINHVVAWYELGKRERKSFADEGQAKAFARATAERLAGQGSAVLTLTEAETLSYRQACAKAASRGSTLDSVILEWEEAKRLLGGGSVVEAARFYATRQTKSDTLSVGDAVTQYLAAKRTAGRSERHVNDLDERLSKFADVFRMPLGQIKADDVAKWVAGMPLANRTKNNFLAAVSSLARFATKRGWIMPGQLDLATVDRYTVLPEEVAIFTPKELAKVIAHARPNVIPVLVLGAFAGCRFSEIMRLTWGQIHFEGDAHYPHGWIELKAGQSKNAAKLRGRARRPIPLQPNLKAWLQLHKGKADEPICPIKHPHESIADASKAAGVAWKDNGLRHSYGSYRMALLRNEHQLAYEMGDSPKIVFAHYHQLVPAARAEEWFDIMPV